MNLRFGLLWIICLLAGLACAAPLPQHFYFVPNLGQWDGDFSFKFERGGTAYFLTETGMTIDLRQVVPPSHGGTIGGAAREMQTDPTPTLPMRWGGSRNVLGHVLRLSYINANPHPEIIGEDLLSHYSNYLLSRDSCRWRGHVPHYQRVIAKEVWPGIDVEYRASEQGIETVYHVNPFADPSQIELRYEGSYNPLSVDANGCLLLKTSLGELREQSPYAYQIHSHLQSQVPVQFYLRSDHSYGFVLGNHDPSQEVVIDPIIYCSYWGGFYDDEVFAIVEDNEHHKLIAGHTYFTYGFPITPGAYCDSAGDFTGFVSKFNIAGDTLLYSTFIGGAELNHICAVTDARGAIYVSGVVYRVGGSVPLTPDAFDSTITGEHEGFISRLSPDGTALEFSSYIGGSQSDWVNAIAVDSEGDVFLCGITWSADFPVTSNAIFPQLTGVQNGFVSVFDPQTSRLSYSTFIPGRMVEPSRIRPVDGTRVWLCGGIGGGGLPVTVDALQSDIHGSYDAFIAEIDLEQNSLVYCSYLGGSRSDQRFIEDFAADVIPMNGDTVIICGSTMCPNFPVTSDAFDTVQVPPSAYYRKVFVTELALPGTIIHSSLLGPTFGSNGIFGIDERHSVVVVGMPYDRRFPLTLNAEDTTLRELFISRLSPDFCRLEYSTYAGGDGSISTNSMLLENRHSIWIAGSTNSRNMPVTPNALMSEYTGAEIRCGYVLCYSMPFDSSDAVHPFIPHPSSFSLSVYPNPFNPTTQISFTLPKAEYVDLNVYDVTGRLVRRLVGGHMGPPLQAGEHEIVFDASDLPSGIYFARLGAGEYTQTQKMVLLK